MRIKNIIVVLVFFFFWGCGNKQSDIMNRFGVTEVDTVSHKEEIINIIGEPKMIVVPSFNPDNEYTGCLDDVFDSIYVIKLETKDHCIVGEISQIEIVNDTIYILDKKTKSVYSFSMGGQYVQKFGQIGQGPGEYVEATSMSVDLENVIIYDQWQHKSIKFDHLGRVLSDYSLPFFCKKVIPMVNGDLLCFEEAADNYHLPNILDYCFWICDSTFSCIKKIGLYSEHDKTIPNGDLLIYHYDDRLFYFSVTKNSYYEIDSDCCFKNLAIVKFDTEYPDEFYTNLDFRINEMKRNNAVAVSKFLMTEEYATYTVSGYGKSACYVYHNLKDNSCKYINSNDISYSQISRVIPLEPILSFYKGMCVFCVSPSNLITFNHLLIKNCDLWDGASEKVKAFDKQLLESITEDDNDILVFAKIKKHFN